MNNVFIKNLWKWKCGLPEKNINKKENIDLDDLFVSEWSFEFENLCRNRLVMGALRYGKLNSIDKHKYDRIESAIKRLEKYQTTGNKEFLVDIANLMMLEFEECNHPLEHFYAIDDGEHVKIK